MLWTLLAAILCCGVLAESALAAETRTTRTPEPAWLTPALKARIHDAGANGVQITPQQAESLNTDCPGFQQPGVSANGCIVSPYGCTANFFWTNLGSAWRDQPYLGTASHCSDNNGQPVIMQVDTTTLAEVGTFDRQTAQEVPGDDFALIKIDPAVAAKWGVNPAIPTGGPQGIYDGCDPQVVKNYGHGYGVYMGQGKPEAGVAPHWYDDAYGWFGVGLPGDSGSGITIQDNRSAGDFTHIIIYDPDLFFAPGELTGMRSTAILQFLGPGWAQVNADGTTSTAGPAACGTSVSGGGSGGGAGTGGNSKPKPSHGKHK